MTSNGATAHRPDRSTFTVLGATGNTGSRVAALLREAGHPVRAVSRRTTPRFDWEDTGTWPAVLEGARGLYLVPPEAPARIDPFVEAATASGVERIVLLSARGPEQSGDSHLIDAEAAVTGGAAAWTVLRPAWFLQNFTQGFFRPALDAGELRLPAGDGREAFIDVDDIAAVAVAALAGDGHAGRVWELSGPETMSFGEAVDRLGRATGNAWRYVPVEPEEFAAEQAAEGMPPEFVQLMLSLLTAIREGVNDHVSTGVQDALGRPPTSLGDFAARVAGARV